MQALEFGAEPATAAVDGGADGVQKTLGKMNDEKRRPEGA